jgi:ABC-2 type transport system ATP-binding protein
MQVKRGEVFGLLGPNGAGKSTLVKIMMTVVRPTRVAGTMLGWPVGHKPTLSRVGYLPEHHRFPRYLTGRQALDFYGALAKVDRRSRRQRAAELLKTVGMTDWADKKVSSYSKGMMQRIGLAQTLINDPDLVVLDEPTDGVDPVGRREIRDVLLQLRNRGKTVFLNSHLLQELELVCDRVAILDRGQVVRVGTVAELTDGPAGAATIEITFQLEGDAETVRAALPADADRKWTALADRRIETTVALAGQPQIDACIDALRDRRISILSMQRRRATLEEAFLEIVKRP